MENKNILLPIEDNGAYLEKRDGFNYLFLFDDSENYLKYVWTSKNNPQRLVFPQLDYSERDVKGLKTIEDCKAIMESDSDGKLIRKKQKEIVEELSKGKICINTGAFNSAIKYSSEKSPITLVFTGNASIKFAASSFGKGVVTIILPKDMQLYKVSEMDSRSRACYNEKYVIAHKMINPQNLDYSDEMIDSVFDAVRVVPIFEISTPELKITVDQEHYFNRKENKISEYPFNQQILTDDNKFVPPEYEM